MYHRPSIRGPLSAIALVLALQAAPAFAQNAPAPAAAEPAKAEPAKWDVNAPPMPTREVTIDTDEGTWMNLDVSPDGRTIAFDLLGDIYVLPIEGGTATRISEGMAFEIQPRFSPDGRRIAFTSDRGGGDNIWTMNTDGSDRRALTTEKFRLMNNPSWSPDGKYIVARKHFTTQRSAGTGEVWVYSVNGGSGAALVERPNPQYQKELGEPVYSPDGRRVYYSRNTTPGNSFEYAQNSNTQIFAIDARDLITGKTENVVSGAGGSVRPQPSPDGKSIAFIRRERTKSKLYVKNLETGEERKIYDQMDQDLQETWAVQGVYPNMAWMPDGKSIVFWAGGKIRRVDVATGEARIIPFRVTDTRSVIDPIRPQIEVAPDRFRTTMPRFATQSPDGRTVVFESLGKLYVKPAGGGDARRLTKDSALELFPSFSRDGKQLVYVSWTDQGLGEVRVMPASGGSSRAITKQPGHYRRPQFSPDGKSIVVEKGQGGFITSGKYSENTGIYRIPLDGSAPLRISTDGRDPHFGGASDRIYFSTSGGDKGLKLVSVDMSGNDRRDHAQGEMVSEYRVAPDGSTLAFSEDYNLFVMPFMPGPVSFGAGAEASQFPVTRASAKAATFIGWSGNGSSLTWSLGPTFYSAPVAPMLARKEKGQTGYVAPESGTDLSMGVAADKPSGMIALTGGKIVTMADDSGGIIDNAVILIDGNRIVAVGKVGEVDIPAAAKRVDVTGKTIIPGMIDAHAHGAQGTDELIPQLNWVATSHLAFGVTTVHDPSNQAAHIFAAAERQREGSYLAPRLFSSGEVVYGAKAPGIYAVINDAGDAEDHLGRLKAQGAHSVKNYNQPRREQRQQVVAASQKVGIISVAEGGSLYGMDITIIIDGNTTLEHNIPQNILYNDVISLYSQTKVGYTPTLVVTYGGLAGDPYWRGHTDVFAQPLMVAHAPPDHLAESVRRPIAPESDYVDDDSAREARKLMQRGVPVSIGAHGQEEGLGSHWELWSFVRGGWTPIEALRAATIVPARSLGMDKDIGSLEPGKLADLVIIDGDPTQDIRQSERIDKVMLNGRLYDAKTLNEEVSGDHKRIPYFWE